ncbi:unnamed protein product [Effrenium voratum]|nr:unnamed protein product [Effrenium voratum]
MRTISTLIVLLTLTLCAARSPGLNRRLQEDGNVTFVPLPPKIQYPLDPGAMIGGESGLSSRGDTGRLAPPLQCIGGAFVGALGVPFLFGTGVGARDWTADLWLSKPLHRDSACRSQSAGSPAVRSGRACGSCLWIRCPSLPSAEGWALTFALPPWRKAGRRAFAQCTNCSTVDAADWIFCLDTKQVSQTSKKRRRAKDKFAKESLEVDLKRLEDLTLELFKAHDLNDDGLLQEAELVSLNERIAMLHHGKAAIELQEVRDTYHRLFRTKLNPHGDAVPYEVFRRYARGVLDELDQDPEAQEMILEQFVAEARAGRESMDISVHGDVAFVDDIQEDANFDMGPMVCMDRAAGEDFETVWHTKEYSEHSAAVVDAEVFPLPRPERHSLPDGI